MTRLCSWTRQTNPTEGKPSGLVSPQLMHYNNCRSSGWDVITHASFLTDISPSWRRGAADILIHPDRRKSMGISPARWCWQKWPGRGHPRIHGICTTIPWWQRIHMTKGSRWGVTNIYNIEYLTNHHMPITNTLQTHYTSTTHADCLIWCIWSYLPMMDKLTLSPVIPDPHVWS